MVVFEAPHRTAATLAAMSETFGADRAAAVCRELTKTHEEVRRGALADLIRWAAGGVRGEVTIVVGGALPASSQSHDIVALVAEQEAAGLTRRDAIDAVARDTGLRRRAVYEAVHRSDPPG